MKRTALFINWFFNLGGGGFISQKRKANGFAMLDGLVSFSIIILAAGFLLPLYTGLIIQKHEFSMEEEALGRLFEAIHAFQYMGEPLFTGESRLNGDVFRFHLKEDAYCVDYPAAGKETKSFCEKVPPR